MGAASCCVQGIIISGRTEIVSRSWVPISTKLSFPKTQWADPAVVEAASDQWSDNYVQCRAYGHTWKPQTVYRVGGHSFIILQRCSRCKNKRECEMDSHGYATSWKMIYRDGYLLEGMGRVSSDGRAILRLAAIRHFKVEDLPEE